MGNNWNAAVSMLKQEYKEGETSLDEALDLAIKVCIRIRLDPEPFSWCRNYLFQIRIQALMKEEKTS